LRNVPKNTGDFLLGNVQNLLNTRVELKPPPRPGPETLVSQRATLFGGSELFIGRPFSIDSQVDVRSFLKKSEHLPKVNDVENW
jgi:hypothetical protein